MRHIRQVLSLKHMTCQDNGMLNAGMLVTVVSRHFGCTRKIIEHLRRRFRVTGNLADRSRSVRPRVTAATNDRYIVLQHLRNRRLTAAATGRHYGIHPQAVRNRIRQNFQPIHAYRRTSVKFSPDLIELQGGIGATITCISNVLIGI